MEFKNNLCTIASRQSPCFEMSNASESTYPIQFIHSLNSSTKMTLNDRFTTFKERPRIRDPSSEPVDVESGQISPRNSTSVANRRLLKYLAQKHTRDMALKIKRRSMRPKSSPSSKSKPRTYSSPYNVIVNGIPMQRSSVKTLRLGPTGRLYKTNSITNVATMKADLFGTPMRRSNSVRRMLDRTGVLHSEALRGTYRHPSGQPTWIYSGDEGSLRRRSRSRSRSQNRRRKTQLSPGPPISHRSRFNSRISGAMNRNRSRSNTRNPNAPRTSGSVPISRRLGTRPVDGRSATRRQRFQTQSDKVLYRVNNSSKQIRRRRLTPTRNRGTSMAGGNRISRARGRNVVVARNRSRSRTTSKANGSTNPTNGINGNSKHRRMSGGVRGRRPSTGPGPRPSIASRSRSSVRSGSRPPIGAGPRPPIGLTNQSRARQRGRSIGRNGRVAAAQNQQIRRGRSRSRSRRAGRNSQLGKEKTDVKKETLDKEIDEYMASSRNITGNIV